MHPESIIRGLRDPHPAFVCENLRNQDDTKRYRVPLTSLRLWSTCGIPLDVQAARNELQNLGDFPNASQFSALFGDAKGFALLASSNAISSANIAEAKSQEMAGSIIVFPPQDWKIERRRIARWLAEDAGGVFDGLPYTFDDIVPFAGVNFSPDRWYVVRRGPMAGSICLWTHDGDSVMEEPWANDLRSWAERVWAELPDVLCGLVRFTASDSIDECPDDAELYPVEFLRDMHAQ